MYFVLVFRKRQKKQQKIDCQNIKTNDKVSVKSMRIKFYFYIFEVWSTNLVFIFISETISLKFEYP